MLVASCLPEVAPNEGRGVVEYGEFPEETIAFPDEDDIEGFGEVEPGYGFAGGERVEFYDFGEVAVDDDGKPKIHPMYVFYDEDGKSLATLSKDGKAIEGQYPVVDTLPNRPGYSPFWELVKVTVPADYTLNRHKSAGALAGKGVATGRVVNCPIVDIDDELAGGFTRRSEAFPRTPLWFRGLQAFCFLLDDGVKAITKPDDEDALQLATDLRAQDGYLPTFAFRLDDPAGGRSSTTFVESEEGLIFSARPGEPDYSPLARVHLVYVGSDFGLGDLWSREDIDALVTAQGEESVKPRVERPYVNASVRGVVPSCTTNDECAEPDDEDPLTCNLDLTPARLTGDERRGYCDTPPVGFGRECGPGIARCDPFGGPEPAAGVEGAIQDLVCVGLRSREKRFCYNGCQPEKDDQDPAEDRDSRCGSVRGFQCFGLSARNKPSGACLKRCNALASSTLVEQCSNPTAETTPPPAPQDITCGNAQLDYGEACDATLEDTPPDSCNPGCTISTADSAAMEAAQPDKNPIQCTSAGIDVCIFPDERAEEL